MGINTVGLLCGSIWVSVLKSLFLAGGGNFTDVVTVTDNYF